MSGCRVWYVHVVIVCSVCVCDVGSAKRQLCGCSLTIEIQGHKEKEG